MTTYTIIFNLTSEPLNVSVEVIDVEDIWQMTDRDVQFKVAQNWNEMSAVDAVRPDDVELILALQRPGSPWPIRDWRD